jgi:hypothetical protein
VDLSLLLGFPKILLIKEVAELVGDDGLVLLGFRLADSLDSLVLGGLFLIGKM